MPNKESWNRHKQPDGYVHSESKVPVKSFPHGFRYTVKVIRIPFWLILFLFGLVARTFTSEVRATSFKKAELGSDHWKEFSARHGFETHQGTLDKVLPSQMCCSLCSCYGWMIRSRPFLFINFKRLPLPKI